MQCYVCGSRMRTAKERVHYTACGLSNVYLDGVSVSRCPSCGEVETAIADMAGVHRELALAIAGKAGALAGEEVRFIRTYLGLSGVELARQMGVTPETVSRWEHGLKVGPTAERLLRMLALHGSSPPSAEREDEERIAPMRIFLRAKRAGWQRAAVGA